MSEKMTAEQIEALGNVGAIKKLFERKDALSPNGQTCTIADMKGITAADREALGALAKAELLNPSVAVY